MGQTCGCGSTDMISNNNNNNNNKAKNMLYIPQRKQHNHASAGDTGGRSGEGGGEYSGVGYYASFAGDGGWDGEGRDEKAVRHKCGFTTAHAMVRNIHRCFAVTACSSTHKRPRVQSLLTTFQNGLNVTTNPLLGIS